MASSSIKRFALASLSLMLVLGLVTVGLAFTIDYYRGHYLLLFLGSVVVVVSAIYLPIVAARRDDDPRSVAVPSMQSLWVSTSMGLGYLVTAPAPYFKLTHGIQAAMAVLGAVMLVYGLYALITLSRRTGVPLAV